MKYYFGTKNLYPADSEEYIFELFSKVKAMNVDGFETATHYPENGNLKDFRLTEKLLAKWIKSSDQHKTDVLIRSGALNNNSR